MRFVTIVAACTACAILTLGVIGGQAAVGNAADARLVDRTVAPSDMLKDDREPPLETVHNGV